MKYALTFLAGDLWVARVPLRAVAERRVLENNSIEFQQSLNKVFSCYH